MSAGDIVVMHDGHHVDPRADRQYTIDAVSRIVPALRAKGFVFRTVCEELSGPEAHVDPVERTDSIHRASPVVSGEPLRSEGASAAS